ncbi:(d)CMP kinase [Calidifontibacter sp. DB0510]|uniref:Cytidylate kinase n=1 Tax=Metallococcus carri TaxID=1656884 RepID=A0A967B2X8_9MICO|nr:(d)CMP kinase [Metallococcus carri]NHN57009.1 (d)CMP kinase [Metallococcus carri]NOP37754.1 (d)CMP kinase [Calidifontibacter sp. DB2511S]
MSDQPLMIAIDGPSGTGKSSVSKAVARALGVGYLDTGAMYRALTWWCLDQGIDLSDQAAVAREAASYPLEMGTDPAAPSVSVGGRAIDAQIREGRITAAVSQVATNLQVRALMRDKQHALMQQIASATGGVVAEGRDITTVVAPDAQVRILMTASEEARMARRSKELAVEAESTRSQIVDRDRIDSTVSQFHTAADGVVTVDTTTLNFEESVEAVLAIARGAGSD